jgi:choline dehydrogenase-like flavoprotein
MARSPGAGFVPMRKDIETDIAIVGSGPVGAATAWRLAVAGLSPLIIEKGPVFDASALERDRADWELRRATELSSNPNIRGAPFDDPVDDRDTPIKPMFAHGTGGTSLHWSAHVPRFRPEDFRVHSLDGVARDWPISWHDLSPFYELVEQQWGTA